MKRPDIAWAAALAIAGALAACGDDVAYVPAAYGQAGQCYYVESPAEVDQLHAQHLCPAQWVPTPMPLWWHTQYAGFYDSPAYYGVYVPFGYRQTYVQHVTVFERQYAPAISRDLSRGSWKGSDGRAASGATVADKVQSGGASFGGGNARSAGFASGGGSVAGPVKLSSDGNSGTSKAPPPRSGGGDSGSGYRASAPVVRSGSSGFSGGGARGR